MNAVAPNGSRRSGFVTALAWVFIVLAGFATMISLLQNVMVAIMFPAEEMAKATQLRNDMHAPWFVLFMFEHVRILFFAFFVVCVATLGTAIGLLLRKNWARLLFIGLMVFGILWNIGASVFSFVILSDFPGTTPAQAGTAFAGQFDLMSKIMIGFNIAWTLAFTLLFAWIAKRLMSPGIRAEF